MVALCNGQDGSQQNEHRTNEVQSQTEPLISCLQGPVRPAPSPSHFSWLLLPHTANSHHSKYVLTVNPDARCCNSIHKEQYSCILQLLGTWHARNGLTKGSMCILCTDSWTGVGASPRTNSRALPVVVVNLTVTLAGKLLLICKCSDGLDPCEALTEVRIHRGPGGGVTSLQFHIRAPVVLLEEEIHNHEGNHACKTVAVLSKLLSQRTIVGKVWEKR